MKTFFTLPIHSNKIKITSVACYTVLLVVHIIIGSNKKNIKKLATQNAAAGPAGSTADKIKGGTPTTGIGSCDWSCILKKVI